MLKFLQGPHLAVVEARSAMEFKKCVIRFANTVGFELVSAMFVVDHSRGHTEFNVVDNMPAAYGLGFNDASLQLADPVMQHCKSSAIPVVWDQASYLEADRANLWEEQAGHGLKTGVATAIHLPGDRHFFIGVDRAKPLPRRPQRLAEIVAELQLFAVHAQDAALRIFCPDLPSVEGGSPLTPRETGALRWTMEGKSAAAVGEILNISERTAVFHLQNAMRKLGCTSKHQAVLKAMRLGLIAKDLWPGS